MSFRPNRRGRRMLVVGCGWFAALSFLGSVVPAAPAQDDSLQTINADYLRDLNAVEKKRLLRLEKLAGSLKDHAATEAYIAFFQTALNAGMYPEAEPVAERLLKDPKLDHRVGFLAQVTNLLAEIDRGDYEGSLKSLTEAVRVASEQAPDAQPVALVLPKHTRISLLQTYYQKLVHANQFEVARRAFELIAANSKEDITANYARDRVARLSMLGKPAPGIKATDIDGKAFDLAGEKGNVVLVVFWASWCLPCGPESEMLDQVFESYKGKGLRVVGINVDNLEEGADPASEIAEEVRHFVVEHNLHFTNLINGAGVSDFAKAYGVRDIPANFLIDREGNVVHVDLTISNVDAAVGKALGK